MNPRGQVQVRCSQGSTLVIVLWIAFGLVSLALYFGHSMSFELRASDNRVAGIAAEQAIDAAERYLMYALTSIETNGVMPDPATYWREAVPVGNASAPALNAHFWLIGRDTNTTAATSWVTFGLVDEASKLNLNTATSNMLVFLPRMTVDLTTAILDWRNTNGGNASFNMYYGMHTPPYENKAASFDTVEELKLLYGADMYTLAGEDLNGNGALDPNELDENRNGIADRGVLDYLTVYSREPNTYSNGTQRINLSSVSQNGPLPQLLESVLGQSRAQQILTSMGLVNMGGPGGQRPGRPGGGNITVTLTFTSPLQFYRTSRMTADEFAQIANCLTTKDGTNYIEGRVNVNTASAAVLSCLPGLVDNPGLADTLITYRAQNPTRLTSIAWVVDALGQNNATALDALARSDCITTESYQFTADVAALGPYGRGYRRVKFIFDTVDGTPKIIYRQDLTHLGWALGKDVRQTWFSAAKDSR
jgi:DNA uptake protein ComE-like DNA-binding protein